MFDRNSEDRDGGETQRMSKDVAITCVQPEDAAHLAAVHVAARRDAMPYLPERYSAEQILVWFKRRVQETPEAFRAARSGGHAVGYMVLSGDRLDDLYVLPCWHRHGVGSALLATAQSLSPRRIVLSTFQQNTRAQAFYEARGFREVGRTAGQNEEGAPDIQYEWLGA